MSLILQGISKLTEKPKHCSNAPSPSANLVDLMINVVFTFFSFSSLSHTPNTHTRPLIHPHQALFLLGPPLARHPRQADRGVFFWQGGIG
jgi:hypothetical protein